MYVYNNHLNTNQEKKMARPSKSASIHEAGHAVIAKSFGYDVMWMEPFGAKLGPTTVLHEPYISAAGCIAVSVFYKRALSHGFIMGEGSGDWLNIKKAYLMRGIDKISGADQRELFSSTARYVRQHIHVIKELAELHQANEGLLDGDQLEVFFTARHY